MNPRGLPPRLTKRRKTISRMRRLRRCRIGRPA
ncbi:hypothetical protein J2S69_002481 [Glycomyces lechevalierae]|uniref:Uncharacterized protein n=1 Tax=Glycomyces lechevalierae TaxID=256034 RepID=A0ABU2ANJ0_9ACTN|nr:hypothetical protein [Glycomyces lechevalierae]